MFSLFSFAVDLHVQHAQWSFNQEFRHVEFIDIPYMRHVNNTICLTCSYRWLTVLVVSF